MSNSKENTGSLSPGLKNKIKVILVIFHRVCYMSPLNITIEVNNTHFKQRGVIFRTPEKGTFIAKSVSRTKTDLGLGSCCFLDEIHLERMRCCARCTKLPLCPSACKVCPLHATKGSTGRATRVALFLASFWQGSAGHDMQITKLLYFATVQVGTFS